MENAREVSLLLFLSNHDKIGKILNWGCGVLLIDHVICSNEILILFNGLSFNHVVNLTLNVILSKHFESADDNLTLEKGVFDLSFLETSVKDF